MPSNFGPMGLDINLVEAIRFWTKMAYTDPGNIVGGAIVGAITYFYFYQR
jgi:formate/nitrite transporter FocA (FNT family)